MTTGRTFVNALVGAVVAIVLSFLPFSTVVGGAVSGFLQGPNEREGALAGALAGAIMFLPFVAIAAFVLGLIGIGIGAGGLPVGGFAVALFAVGLASSIVLLYTVGLALVGGYLGAFLAREYPRHRSKTRETIGLTGDSPPSAPGERPTVDRGGREYDSPVRDERDDWADDQVESDERGGLR